MKPKMNGKAEARPYVQIVTIRVYSCSSGFVRWTNFAATSPWFVLSFSFVLFVAFVVN